jgi:hypothetical protein
LGETAGCRRVPPASPAAENGHSTRCLRGIGHRFRVETWDRSLTAYLDGLFGAMAEPCPGVCGVYAFVDRGPSADWRYALTYDGEVLKEAHQPALLLGRLMHAVNRAAVTSAPGTTILHAAAVQLGEATVVLPAEMGAGKSTLTAALVKNGFQYLTDEAVPVCRDDLVAAPFPKPLGLAGAAVRIHADLAPDMHPLVEGWARRAWLVPVETIRRDVVGRPASPTTIVLPRYDPRAGTRMAPTGRASAVQALAQRTFGFHDAGRRNLDVLGRLVRQARCFTMTVDDLDRACALVREAATESLRGRYKG